MKRKATRISQWALILATPLTVVAFSTGPPIARTGAAVDGGLNCTACHHTFGAANTGFGRLIINAAPYTPGVKQTITITNTDPEARRWGFQITARLKSAETRQAGTFTATDLVRVRCAPDGRDGPCNGDREFAEHQQPYTQLGTPPPGIHQVEWTPPSEDVGEIIFYAAGNAANGDGTNNGDHIYTTSFVIPSTICTLTGKPSISAVASATGTSLIATNTLIAISGSFVPGGSYPVTPGDLRDGKLPSDQFRCVVVEVNDRRAPLLYVSRDQINAQAPILELNGTVDVRVIVNPGSPQEIRSDAAKVQAGVYAPSFFTSDGKHIVAVNASKGNTAVGPFSVFPPAAPAQPGDTVSLYGTGFGVLEPVYQPGEFAPEPTPLRDPVTVTVGDTTLESSDILYAGASGEMAGMCLFKLKLPATLPDGDIPVVIRIGSAQTQSGAVIAVKN